jgi:hypothetical protein
LADRDATAGNAAGEPIVGESTGCPPGSNPTDHPAAANATGCATASESIPVALRSTDFAGNDAWRRAPEPASTLTQWWISD